MYIGVSDGAYKLISQIIAMETALIFQIVYPTWVARAETTLLIGLFPLRKLVVDFCLSYRFESWKKCFWKKTLQFNLFNSSGETSLDIGQDFFFIFLFSELLCWFYRCYLKKESEWLSSSFLIFFPNIIYEKKETKKYEKGQLPYLIFTHLV